MPELLTLIVVLLAAWIAYLQWRTAQSKTVIALFERRMTVYTPLRELLGDVIRRPDAVENRAARLIELRHEAQFLFGDDVLNCIKKIEDVMLLMEQAAQTMSRQSASSQAVSNAAHRSKYLFRRFRTLFSKLMELLSAYLKMDQKVPTSTSRNAGRLARSGHQGIHALRQRLLPKQPLRD